MDEDIYVIVTENPGFISTDRLELGFISDGPYLFDNGIKHSLTLANAKTLIKSIPKRFGKCRIAKLVFVEDEK